MKSLTDKEFREEYGEYFKYKPTPEIDKEALKKLAAVFRKQLDLEDESPDTEPSNLDDEIPDFYPDDL